MAYLAHPYFVILENASSAASSTKVIRRHEAWRTTFEKVPANSPNRAQPKNLWRLVSRADHSIPEHQSALATTLTVDRRPIVACSSRTS